MPLGGYRGAWRVAGRGRRSRGGRLCFV